MYKSRWISFGLGAAWLTAAYTISLPLNQIPSNTEYGEFIVPVCSQQSGYMAASKDCLANERRTYGVPLPYKRVYLLSEPSEFALGEGRITEIERPIALFGEELAVINGIGSNAGTPRANLRKFYNSLSHNFVLLLVTPPALWWVVRYTRQRVRPNHSQI